MAKVVRICSQSDVREDAGTQINIEGMPALAAYIVDGDYHVVDDMCTHGMAWLSEGYLEGTQLECPFHGGRFDLKTGEATAFPCVLPIKVYKTVLVGDDLCVEVEDD